ncbi:transcription initiation factor TFIID subunit 7-like [Psammomys obesus]|uniref:transcription initiation factor TFIID subunit 7-like n=1 Tax=Psammomys obesus TaxID=48139 RepID=UPI002452BFB6|nr:transcription initiation factor TFIID subunit 7-like [Psammomys obesus]
MGSQEPQVPVSLCAESAVDISESGGARGPEIPFASTSWAQAQGHRRSCSRGRSIEKSMRAMSVKCDEPYAIEEQFLLRLPSEHACAVRKVIHSRGAAKKNKLKIDFSADGHSAVVQVDNVSLPAKLVNLPCVVGSLKTVDRKTFYKTADISQMLVCSADGKPHSSPEEHVTSTDPFATGNGDGKTEEKKYNWKHGITPPLKNVRKKRFRNTTKKHPDVKQMDDFRFNEYIKSPDVKNEVKRLLRSDAEAIRVRWEVIKDDETKEPESHGCIPSISGSPQMSGLSASEYDKLGEMADDSGSNSNDVEDKNDKIEEEEEEEEDDKDEENDKEIKELETDNSEEELERELQIKFMQFSLYGTSEDYSSIIMGIRKLIHYKEKNLTRIYKKAQRQTEFLETSDNFTLKRYFENTLRHLSKLEKQKCEQIYHLQEQLKCFLKE